MFPSTTTSNAPVALPSTYVHPLHRVSTTEPKSPYPSAVIETVKLLPGWTQDVGSIRVASDVALAGTTANNITTNIIAIIDIVLAFIVVHSLKNKGGGWVHTY